MNFEEMKAKLEEIGNMEENFRDNIELAYVLCGTNLEILKDQYKDEVHKILITNLFMIRNYIQFNMEIIYGINKDKQEVVDRMINEMKLSLSNFIDKLLEELRDEVQE